MGRYSGLYRPQLTRHAVERWEQRVGVQREGSRMAAAVALTTALEVPRRLWPYFRVDDAEMLLWAPGVETLSVAGVLFVVREGLVVTCFPPWGEAHRTLLRRLLMG